MSVGGAFYRTLRQWQEFFVGLYVSGGAFCRTLRQWVELFIGLYVRFGCVA